MWMRFLSRYPKQLFRYEDWYFVARLTMNMEYGDVQFGDRILAVWQGLDKYLFSTTDASTSKANVNDQVKVSSVEGLWTYVYYSYQKGRVIAMVYSSDYKKTLEMKVTHPKVTSLRFVLGGSDVRGLFIDCIIIAEGIPWVQRANRKPDTEDREGSIPEEPARAEVVRAGLQPNPEGGVHGIG